MIYVIVLLCSVGIVGWLDTHRSFALSIACWNMPNAPSWNLLTASTHHLKVHWSKTFVLYFEDSPRKTWIHPTGRCNDRWLQNLNCPNVWFLSRTSSCFFCILCSLSDNLTSTSTYFNPLHLNKLFRSPDMFCGYSWTCRHPAPHHGGPMGARRPRGCARAYYLCQGQSERTPRECARSVYVCVSTVAILIYII